ncbi:MAG: PorT family protein [Balneolaceae bacterium]|nr:MAG: PorT family protein [Balneolaceae bacterium]
MICKSKGVLFLLMPLAVIEIAFAQSDLKFGAHAGINIANFSGMEIDYESRTGFKAGISVEIPLDGQVFDIETGAYYSQKGATGFYREPIGNVGGNFGNAGTLKLDYVDIPVLASFNIERSGSFHPQIIAGPYLAVNISSKANEADDLYIDKIDEYVRLVDVGLMIGGGGIISRESLNIRVRASYTFGFTSVFDSEIESDEKNRVFSITAGILF